MLLSSKVGVIVPKTSHIIDNALDGLLARLDNPLSAAQVYVLKANSKEAMLMHKLYKN